MDQVKPTYSELEKQVEALKEELRILRGQEEILTDGSLKYDSLIQNHPDLILIQEAHGTTVFISPQVENVIGHDIDTFLGVNFPEFIHPDDRTACREALQKALMGEPLHDFEYRFYTKRGELIWLSHTAIPIIKNNQLKFIHSHIRNITKQKQIEFELIEAKKKAEESEYRYKDIVSIMPDGVVIHQEGQIIYANEAACKIIKSPNAEKIIGLPVIQFVHPDYQTLAIERIKLNLAQKTPAFAVEEIFIGLDGSQIDVLVTAIPFQFNSKPSMLTVFTDITHLKQVEQELIKARNDAEEKANLLRNITDNIPAYVAAVDINKLTYKFVNKRYVEGFGKKHEEIIGAHIQDIISKPNADFAMKYIEEVRKGNPSSYINTFSLTEGVRHVQVKFVPGYVDKGELKDIIVLSQDITDIKKTETELREAKERAEESDLLKTAFLQNMSHEIRTPMNAIVGFSGLLDNPEISADKRKSFISIIRNSTNQLLSIINDILSISSIETNQVKCNIEPVCMNTVLIDLMAIYKSQAYNHNIALYVRKPLTDSQSEVYTDKTKITQVLTNLLTNALKFTHKGFIEFGYTLKTDQGSHELEFYVKDSGIGIDNNLQSKIFDRFQQGKSEINLKYGGTGLGLAISKAYIELLGGKIWVESNVNEGSTFFFTLPYKVVNAQAESTQTDIHAKTNTILVAEDEEFNFLFLEEVLIGWDITIIAAKDGIEAIEKCKQNPDIDVALIDIKMPRLDGFEAAKEIRKIRPNLPIIAQSAYALDHDRRRFSGDVFNDYLTKPTSKLTLYQTLSKYISIKIHD
jgi:PAS domain S-box-containing protein